MSDLNLSSDSEADPSLGREAVPAPTDSRTRISDDWLAIACAAVLLVVSLTAVFIGRVADETSSDGPATASVAADDSSIAVAKPTSTLKGWVGKPAKWSDAPLSAFSSGDASSFKDHPVAGVLGAFLILSLLLSVARHLQGHDGKRFFLGFVGVFLLATFAYTLAAQSVVKSYNLEYALWALGVGLIISNTVGTPRWLRPAVSTEFFIKTGLVLLGAEVLMSRLMALGLPGVFVAWLVTPIVLISTYIFGQKVLKMESRSLNMVISADMSVCGVSAAIAAAAACKAKKEELSLAIGMSLSFTVVMMIVMPWVIRLMGLGEIVGGAWMGGTIDATGAVAAAGATLGDKALEVAATVKMIQNILIGASAFGIATYWVTRVEKDSSGARPGISEIWNRFPRFVLGFIAASIIFSVVHGFVSGGPEIVDAMIKGSSKTFRGWFFCLAFVSIGLETRFSELLPYFRGGKPVILYVCGQSLNIILTLIMAYLMFGILFKDFVQ